MFGIKRRRTLIRVLSYTVSAFLLVAISAAVFFVSAYKFRMSIEYSYQRSLSELADHVNNIDLALKKGYYASTSSQLAGLSSQIWSDAGAANADISEMPLSKVDLSKTTLFISQVGDYANSLGRKLSQSQTVSDSDRTTIKNLSQYASQLSLELSDIQSDLQSGRLSLFKSERVLNTSNIRSVSTQPNVEDGFLDIENSLSNLPSMIYDGPFSDNILKKNPLLTKNQPDVGREKARTNAAAFLGQPAANIKDNGETAGNLPTYNFVSGSTSISVAKNGGFVVRMIDSAMPGSVKLSKENAIKKATDFLASHGIGSMTQTYYLQNNNIATINFAYYKNNVTCYPDLIKLGIALDSGNIVSFDATGYIMNHTSRNLTSVKISQAAAQAKLNPRLKVDKASLVVIPTADGGEALCYEFLCTGENNQMVLDYFDANTGYEQQVLILLDTPGGTLPM